MILATLISRSAFLNLWFSNGLLDGYVSCRSSYFGAIVLFCFSFAHLTLADKAVWFTTDEIPAHYEREGLGLVRDSTLAALIKDAARRVYSVSDYRRDYVGNCRFVRRKE